AGHRRPTQGRRPRSLRARSGPAASRARELQTPSRRRRLDRRRRRTVEERGGRGGRHGPGPATRAAVSARTSLTPAAFSARAQASIVAPVVHTTSTRTTTAPRSDRQARDATKAPRTL